MRFQKQLPGEVDESGPGVRMWVNGVRGRGSEWHDTWRR